MIGIRFEETMSGTLRVADGAPPAERPFSFTVEARGRRLSHLWSGAPLDLSGVVDLAGSVSRVSVRGTLTVEPIGGRRLVYELFWRDGQRRPHRFFGKKDLTLRHPLASMTILRGTVYRAGDVLGDATLKFELRDLPEFLGSMRPVQVNR